jgi:hypothetical protein
MQACLISHSSISPQGQCIFHTTSRHINEMKIIQEKPVNTNERLHIKHCKEDYKKFDSHFILHDRVPGDEVYEFGGPLIWLSERRWGLSWNHEYCSHRMNISIRRFTFSHLQSRDTFKLRMGRFLHEWEIEFLKPIRPT